MEPPAKKRKLTSEEPKNVSENSSNNVQKQENFLGIDGLYYIPQFLSKDEEKRLFGAIDSQPWSTQLARRVQHYGFRYDYKAKTVPASALFEPLPEFVDFVIDRLRSDFGFFGERRPDQLIVNGASPTLIGAPSFCLMSP